MGKTWQLVQEAGWECGRGKKRSGSGREQEVGQLCKPYEPTISGVITPAGPLLLEVP